MTDFITKDSGERAQFDSGMQRDTEKGKARFDLIAPLDVPYEEQLLTRVAALLGRGAEKYTERNWEMATGDAELARFKSSAFRHFMQWLTGETDEDHAAAVVFNLLGHETTAYKMRQEQSNLVEFVRQIAMPTTAPEDMPKLTDLMREQGIFLGTDEPESGRVEQGWGDIPFGAILKDDDDRWWIMDGTGRYGWRLRGYEKHTRDMPKIVHKYGIDDDGEYGIVDPIWGFIPWGTSLKDDDHDWWTFDQSVDAPAGNQPQRWHLVADGGTNLDLTYIEYRCDLTYIEYRYGIRDDKSASVIHARRSSPGELWCKATEVPREQTTGRWGQTTCPACQQAAPAPARRAHGWS